MQIADKEYPDFRTKAQARKYVKSLGYTKLVDVTETGREYYQKPDASGQFKRPAEVSISKVGPDWLCSFFDAISK